MRAEPLLSLRAALAAATRTFRPWTPRAINDGRCLAFALAVHRRMPAVTIVHADGHVFLRYRGRFYDAECPAGVTAAHRLPLYRRWKVARVGAVVFRALLPKGVA